MNLVYLHSHDTGREIQPYGCPVNTPNLQQLAEEGILFRDAHCAGPTCSPSRAALLTGEYPHQAGMVGLSHRGGALNHPERHLASVLGNHGYETVVCGMHHLGQQHASLYSQQSGIPARFGGTIADYASNFITRQGHNRPFFLDVGFFETHRTGDSEPPGFSCPEHSPGDGECDSSYVIPPRSLPNTPETRRDWLDYAHSAGRLDHYYGQILEALDESGLAGDTLVIATTDHGIAFPHHKCSLTARGTGVLLILRLPKAFEGGRAADALVSHLDIYPTICDLLGIAHPDWLQGKSLTPILTNKTDSIRDEIFSEVTFHGAFEPKRCVRTKDWNYIRNFAAPHPPILPNCDNSLSKEFLLDRGLANHTVPPEELYDLTFDPLELHNLASDPNHAATLESQRQKLADWMARTNDPILSESPDVLPPNLMVNTWAETHPGTPHHPWQKEDWAKISHTVH